MCSSTLDVVRRRIHRAGLSAPRRSRPDTRRQGKRQSRTFTGLGLRKAIPAPGGEYTRCMFRWKDGPNGRSRAPTSRPERLFPAFGNGSLERTRAKPLRPDDFLNARGPAMSRRKPNVQCRRTIFRRKRDQQAVVREEVEAVIAGVPVPARSTASISTSIRD